MYDDEEMEFTEEAMEEGLRCLIEGEEDENEICWENMQVQTFAEAGVMTCNNGLVITLPDGSEYQLSIVRSR